MISNNLDGTIRIMDIMYSSAVDGEGFRDVLFVNYCPHHCKGCHNPESWEIENGRVVSLSEVYENLTKSRITNITYSGGEPFCQTDELIALTKKIKENTNKTVWIYSGYLFEDLIKDEKKKQLLSMCEVLVDGRFEENKKELNLRFKGSTNQRIIDVQKSLKEKKIILFDR